MEREAGLRDGSSVIIRPYCIGDVESAYEAVRESIGEISPWMAWCHREYSVEDSRRWVESRPRAWERGTEYDFVIADSENGVFLGGCGLNRIDKENRFANLGYWVGSRQTGRGIATAAVRLVAAFGFTELALGRIEIVVATGNAASQRVAEKVGATREGCLRNRLVVRDKVYDAVMFSLIPRDVV